MLIQGTTIQLYDGETVENVSNVLIGESSSDGTVYTLAIPKGDTHEWENRLVEFFGRKFRTFGLPEQGIEANIPLMWHKKIKAEYLKINNSCTVYEKDNFTRHHFSYAYICDKRSSKAAKDGIQTADSLEVYIYLGTAYKPKISDIIVSGKCDFVFSTATEKEISESFKEFRKLYPDYAVINSIEIQKDVDYSIKAR